MTYALKASLELSGVISAVDRDRLSFKHPNALRDQVSFRTILRSRPFYRKADKNKDAVQKTKDLK